MWTFTLGLAILFAGVFLLLVLLSPKGEDRPLVFRCQRCGSAFGNPPLHPLPERYQEEDLCLCEACSELLEENVKEEVQRALADFLGGTGPARRQSGES